MFDVFHNKKEETLRDKRVLCWMFCLKWKLKSAVGYTRLEFTAGDEKFKPHREERERARHSAWGMSTSRGQAGEEGPAEEMGKQGLTRQAGDQHVLVKPGGKVFPGGSSQPRGSLLRGHHWI